LTDLTPQAVRLAMLGWEGAPQTRGGTLRLLRAAMKQAVADRRIEHDPTAGIPYPRIAPHEARTLTGAEARHLMDTVKGERFAPILVLSLGLGVRRGEALGLRTQDVDLVKGEVRISKSMRYIAPILRAEGEGPYRLTGTKTGGTRTVPVPAFVADVLRDRLEERDREQRGPGHHPALRGEDAGRDDGSGEATRRGDGMTTLGEAVEAVISAAEAADMPWWLGDQIEAIRAAFSDSLDAAWAEAEAALPEGWGLRLTKAERHATLPGEGRVFAHAKPPYGSRRPRIRGEGPTPAAALRALAAKLRERAHSGDR
jgi:integrase